MCAQADHVLFLGVGPRQVLCTPCDHQAIQWMCVLLLKGFQYLRICNVRWKDRPYLEALHYYIKRCYDSIFLGLHLGLVRFVNRDDTLNKN